MLVSCPHHVRVFYGVSKACPGEEKYFIDPYSKTNALEDRARIFENMLAPDKKDCKINDYPHIKAKALYIKERITKLYPSLKNTDIFRNLEG